MTAVANRFLDVDPYLKNSLSSNDAELDLELDEDDIDKAVKFDIDHKRSAFKSAHGVNKAQTETEEEIKLRSQPPKDWEIDVRALISSRRWLHSYGLKKNRLELHQILPAIGFKLSDEFDKTLKKPVSSRYGGGLFRQMLRADGKTFNISCSKDKLLQLEKRLLQAIYLFRRRLEWLTTESRRVFGVIEEKSATIVLDIRNVSPQQFDQYRTAIERVLREQVSQVAKFNLIRASEDLKLYSHECVPLSHDTLENAIQWVWNLDRLDAVSNTSAAEAIICALQDQHNEAIYLFTYGTAINSGREVLKEKVTTEKFKAPIHVVSFNCDCSSTIKYLKDFAKTTRGKFHAYGLVMELDAYETVAGEGSSNRANIMLKRKTFGGIPAGAGVREDVVFIFEELEDARNNLAQIRMLIENVPEPNRGQTGQNNEPGRQLSLKNEQYMTSREWLEIYGLDARKLGLYDVLSGVAFKHLDGVVDIMQKPDCDDQTDALIQTKLINARYCERFPIVRWKDGRVVHVQVTPEVHRGYEEKVQVAMNKIQQRIDWLNKGSRSLFGTVVEDLVYILIDTSASMQPSIGFVKQKLFVLMQEQLRHKKKVNFVTFNSKASGWKDRLVEVSERSLQSAWSWIQNLSCWGSTNTYGAIQLAMSDPNTEAVYLLTDGRPDQPPKSIIAQVRMQKSIPIHTISFNCNDLEANRFLYNLAEATNGRYHYYSEGGPPLDEPEAWESMDIKLLKDEIKSGLDNLDKLTGLRDECTSLAWKRETEELRKSIDSTRESQNFGRKSAVPPLDSKDLYRPPSRSSSVPSRPSSAPSQRSGSQQLVPSPPLSGPSTSPRSRTNLPERFPRRPKTAKVSFVKKPLVAGHTRTSLMRTLGSSGRFSPNEWLLPETKQLLQFQAERQKELAKKNENQESMRKSRKKRLIKANEMSSKQWLRKHGLVAKRLTILDALGSTFVNHTPKYISILDKHVMSKVFDEILPIAHVSKGQVRLVNPNGVNLKEYENKLRVAIDSFKRRLNKQVWSALSESAKEEFDSTEPFDFQEHSDKVMLILEREDWPVRESDVKLLSDEIARGEKFLRQSESLRKAAAGEDSDVDENDLMEDPLVESSRSVKSRESFRPSSPIKEGRASPLHDESEDDISDKSVAEDIDNSSEASAHSKLSKQSGGSCDSQPQSDRPRDESPPRSEQETKDEEAIGQVIREVDQSSKGKVIVGRAVHERNVKIKLDTLRGHKIIARKDDDGLYYSAVVVRCSDPRHADVKYSDGTEASILTRNLILNGGAFARPTLRVGDYVLMKVINMDSDDECYVPALIRVGPQNSNAQLRFYSVIMYNGQKASTLRAYLMKISKERYELIVKYVKMNQREERKKLSEIRDPTPPEEEHKEVIEEKSDHQYIPSVQQSEDEILEVEEDVEEEFEEVEEIINEVDEDVKEVSEDEPEETILIEKQTSASEADDHEKVEQNRLLLELKEREEKLKRYKKKLKKKSRKLEEYEKQLMHQMLANMAKEKIAMEVTVSPPPEEEEEEKVPSSPTLMELRRTLQSLKLGEEVLARWSDDGWYYRGIVRHYHGDYSYDLEDSTSFIERIWREDIISENDNTGKDFEINDSVIALHPDYSFSYAPATITYVHTEEVEVKFFDGETESRLSKNEVYHSCQEKHDLDTDYIHQQAERLIGAAVVTKDERNGAYYPGCVEKRTGDGQYVIRWPNGQKSEQAPIHIFSAFTRRPQLRTGDRVLALADPVHIKFLPGSLMESGNGKHEVEFCDGTKNYDIDLSLCYWLGEYYYNDAVKCYTEGKRR